MVKDNGLGGNNWIEIHPDFAKEGWDSKTYQQIWEEKGFSYEETKEWKRVLLKESGTWIFDVDLDWDFCIWVRDEKHLTCQEVERLGNLKYLWEEYDKLWKNIHKDFDYWWWKNWIKINLGHSNVREWIQLGFEPSECEFVIYLINKGYQSNPDLNLEQLREEFNSRLKKIKFVQEYLDNKYQTKEKREQLKEIIIIGWANEFKSSLPFTQEQIKELEGRNLDLSEYPNLERVVILGDYLKSPLTKLELGSKPKLIELVCAKNQLTNLNLNNCSNLNLLDCSQNQLTELKIDNLEKLIGLDCSDNQLTNLNLTNNCQLVGFNCSNNQITNLNIQGCSKLKGLDYKNNPISSNNDFVNSLNFDDYPLLNKNLLINWEDMHEDFAKDSGWIITSTKQKLTWKQLWEYWGFTAEEMKQLVDTGLQPNEYYFGLWLKEKKRSNSLTTLNAKELRKEYNQCWVNIHKDFNKKKYSWSTKTYQHIWEDNGFTYQDAQLLIPVGFKPEEYDKVNEWRYNFFTELRYCVSTPQEIKSWIDAGLTKNDALFAIYLKQNNYTPTTAFQEKGHAQTYLDWKYPQILINTTTYLYISYRNLANSLDLTDFINLEKLYCSGNKLTSLNLNNCLKLKEIDCRDNNLQDLSTFKNLVNLEKLNIRNNPLTGSLEPLQSLGKLRELDISDTDIDKGLEYLPESLEGFSCLAYKKDAKCKAIYNLFASGWWRTETDSFGKIKNFPQKLQVWKEANLDLVIKAKNEVIEQKSEAITQLKEEFQVLEDKHQEQLILEREEFDKALQKAKEWRERQLKEITKQKDREIENLKKQVNQLQTQLVSLEIKEQKAQIQIPPKQ